MCDTIFAQATAPGRAGVAIIRISGPAAHAAAVGLTGSPVAPRRASLRTLSDPRTSEEIDEAVLLHFPAPASFTGEDVVEIQCHGSVAVVRRSLAALAEFDGLRLAEPGEFTRRALENGRLDLAKVEGLSDLLAAETEAQRRQARAVAAGALSARVEHLRLELLEIVALIEAVIDFGDDGVPDSALAPVPARAAHVLEVMDGMLCGSNVAERIREGFVVAICGEPNVGKSTLLNAIAGREVALTSEIAGTTRDVLEVHLDLGGYPVTLLDTAGLRESQDTLERLGIERARARADAADLRVFLVAGSSHVVETHVHEGDLVVRAKADLCLQYSGRSVSGRTGAGVDELLSELSQALATRASGASMLSHERQRNAVFAARGALQRALEFLNASPAALDLGSFELRSSIRALDVLTGRVDVEAVLDQVFKNFCIGK